MTGRADNGVAVIGSGFIGTVHVEALRRIGVRVTGLPPGRRPVRENRLGTRNRSPGETGIRCRNYAGSHGLRG